MKYYKDNQNNVYAYELDGSQDFLIGDKIAMTAEEVELHLNPIPTEEELIAKAKAEALQYLSDTDYITNKYNDEVTVLGTTSKTDFIAKYKEVYDKRAEARLLVGGE